MLKNTSRGLWMAGLAAGIVNGLLGAGGGMVLVPLLSILTALDENEIFPSSVAVILPICAVSLLFLLHGNAYLIQAAIPYLAGSLLGGVVASTVGKSVPSLWLHRTLGIFIIWGGIRYLC